MPGRSSIRVRIASGTTGTVSVAEDSTQDTKGTSRRSSVITRRHSTPSASRSPEVLDLLDSLDVCPIARGHPTSLQPTTSVVGPLLVPRF